MSAAPVVVLAGGTGGAKLARGMLDLVGDDLVVIANTADDTDAYGAAVSPDPDLVTFWLADRIDERGWGLRDDTFRAMDMLRELGADVWFNLGDGDLAWCIERRRRLDDGETPTQALAALAGALGVAARVLPMCDEPVRTRVLARDRWFPFQEFMIRERAEGPVDGVAFDGIEAARPSREVLDALAAARAIVIGPSNPVISIGPILAVPEVLAIETFLGRVDVRLNVIARDMGHYQHIYRDRILTLPHIADIESLMLVSTIKDTGSLPL